ncbi:MAG TPA: ribose-5-phosphate isomerase RpiA [Candidatus Thermoplasmatota archaeon]|nr:ribose-5-phosphate isomerase RpiA [Candidatus Thermoplasmatota archaeon]
MDREALKRQAGEAAAELVTDGMVVGLGTGSTVRFTTEALGRRRKEGLRILGVPTSEATARLARGLGIPLTTLDEHPEVDLTVDGADEFDAELRLIKGGGGALVREKVVARASRRMVVVADASKQVERLGSTFPLPIEVLELGKTPALRFVESLGADVKLRRGPDGRPFRSDNGNPILDAKWPHIADPEELERRLETYPGVVGCGLFLGLCDLVLVADAAGVRRVERKA